MTVSTQTLLYAYGALAFTTAFVGASLRERESYWPYIGGCILAGAFWPGLLVATIVIGIHRQAKRP